MLNSVAELLKIENDPRTAIDRIRDRYRLNELQLNFVRNMVASDQNKMTSFLRAGYLADKRGLIETKGLTPGTPEHEEQVRAKRSAYAQIANLVKNPKIKNAIDEYAKVYIDERKKEIEADVFDTAKLRATFDVRSLADTFECESAEELANTLRKMPPEIGVCIDGLEIDYKGKDADRFVVKMKFADRDKAMMLLAKLTDLAVEKKEVTHHNTAPAINIAILPPKEKS